MNSQRTTVVGVFADRQHAEQCVAELRRMGFRDDQIGVAARDENKKSAGAGSKESYAEEGATLGLAAGAGVGALWGLGAIAGLIPAIGPVIAGGTLAAILASGALGAAAAGLAGGLIGLGIPEDEANYYEGEFKSGRTVVTVKADGRYDEALAVMRRFGGYDMNNRPEHASTTSTSSSNLPHAMPVASSARTEAGQTLQAREEELHVRKQAVETGEVKVRKEVHTEHRTLEVPVKKEEVVIERRAVGGHQAAGSDIRESEEIRIPVSEEQVHIEKTPVVKEEVRIGKRQIQDTETVSGTVRKEEIKVEKEGDVDVRDNRR